MCKIFRTTNHEKELYQEAVVRIRSIKKLFLKFQNPQKTPILESLFSCNFIEIETGAQVFFRIFCEIIKNNYFVENLWTATFIYQ